MIDVPGKKGSLIPTDVLIEMLENITDLVVKKIYTVDFKNKAIIDKNRRYSRTGCKSPAVYRYSGNIRPQCFLTEFYRSNGSY
jgi:hypothetical protein